MLRAENKLLYIGRRRYLQDVQYAFCYMSQQRKQHLSDGIYQEFSRNLKEIQVARLQWQCRLFCPLRIQVSLSLAHRCRSVPVESYRHLFRHRLRAYSR